MKEGGAGFVLWLNAPKPICAMSASHPLRWEMLGEKPGILLYCGYLKLLHHQPKALFILICQVGLSGAQHICRAGFSTRRKDFPSLVIPVKIFFHVNGGWNPHKCIFNPRRAERSAASLASRCEALQLTTAPCGNPRLPPANPRYNQLAYF